MKYCSKCGAELVDDAVVCTKCGRLIENTNFSAMSNQSSSGITTAAKVFMIIGTVFTSLFTYVIGLAWCLPMTIVYFKKIKTGAPIGTGFKVCSLLFVNLLAGILMLCDKEH